MLLKAYLAYLFNAQDEHGLHSPFLFELYNETVKKVEQTPSISWIEKRQRALENSAQTIHITDYGAGSKWNSTNKRKVSNIAKASKKGLKWRKLFYLIIKKYFSEEATILELGTSFGLTTAYLASASASNKVYTFEGCPEISKIAQETFQIGNLNTITQVIGNIDSTLPEIVAKLPTVDFVFFDANHRYEPTISYFEQCLKKVTEQSCFVFDDIYWSDEMKAAWEYIKNHPQVTITLDFYQIGIVFFRTKQPKQHFVLKG